MDDIITPAEQTDVEQDIEISEHRQQRSLILHMLYVMESFQYDISLAAVVDSLNHGFELTIDPTSDMVNTVQAIVDARDHLDQELRPLLVNWRLERVGILTHLIMRLAFWELKNTALDYKIIINEAIELTKCFSEKDAYRFVNGVLDEAVKHLRPTAVS